jgi:NADH-quinone oxidoreductase subunit L
VTPLVTAGITSFYMFRLWFMTFTGSPRDEHVHDHAHENPLVMVAPLVVLSVLAAFCAIGGEAGPLFRLLSFSEPVPAHEPIVSMKAVNLTLPSHHDVHEVHGTAGGLALLAAFIGMGLAYVLYCRPVINPAEIKRQAGGVYDFLVDKWRFDSLYDYLFVRPVHIVGRWCQGFDRNVLDRLLDGSATFTVSAAHWDRWFDETFIDGLVNLVGRATNAFGQSLKVVQTGRLRQYVMWIAVSVVVLFATLFTALTKL